MIYKVYKNNTYNIYTVKTDKFKTCHMEIVFRNNIEIGKFPYLFREKPLYYRIFLPNFAT